MGNIMGRFLELLREFDVVDLSPTLENDIPRWPTRRWSFNPRLPTPTTATIARPFSWESTPAPM